MSPSETLKKRRPETKDAGVAVKSRSSEFQEESAKKAPLAMIIENRPVNPVPNSLLTWCWELGMTFKSREGGGGDAAFCIGKKSLSHHKEENRILFQ